MKFYYIDDSMVHFDKTFTTVTYSCSIMHTKLDSFRDERLCHSMEHAEAGQPDLATTVNYPRKNVYRIYH
jgi:hypothetical protein